MERGLSRCAESAANKAKTSQTMLCEGRDDSKVAQSGIDGKKSAQATPTANTTNAVRANDLSDRKLPGCKGSSIGITNPVRTMLCTGNVEPGCRRSRANTNAAS